MPTIADLDGTIIWGWDKSLEPVPTPWGVRADALLTNQGGVPLRWFLGDRKYPTMRQVFKRIRAGMRLAGARVALAVFYHPRQEQNVRGRLLAWLGRVVPILPLPVPEGVILASFAPYFRKPSGAGLRLLSMGRRNTVFLGDEDSDHQAARAAGVMFTRVGD